MIRRTSVDEPLLLFLSGSGETEMEGMGEEQTCGASDSERKGAERHTETEGQEEDS